MRLKFAVSRRSNAEKRGIKGHISHYIVRSIKIINHIIKAAPSRNPYSPQTLCKTIPLPNFSSLLWESSSHWNALKSRLPQSEVSSEHGLDPVILATVSEQTSLIFGQSPWSSISRLRNVREIGVSMTSIVASHAWWSLYQCLHSMAGLHHPTRSRNSLWSVDPIQFLVS